ncbi:MAG: DUF1329 domain-containing protein [Verrucomicrobia bacterium]|nr:MAG: DUF1329 domain-containing protein [Verrucomicrobiota bacterium]
MSLRPVLTSVFIAAALGYGGHAAIPADEIARLGEDLTPLGAEKAGNADGTIPAWTGGITEPPAGYEPGMHHPDPFAEDDVLFTIDQSSMVQHADQLTAGHRALIQTYETYRMPVYPTRRSASFPERIYAATRKVAATAQLANEGNAVEGAVIGIPFPIPENGQEVIWNHLLRYRGVSVGRSIAQAAPTRRGAYSLVTFSDEFLMNYHLPDMTEDKLANVLTFFRQEVLSPARLAGSILLVHEALDQVSAQRQAWVYNVGQRRVRRAPNVAYDNPGTAADGMRTSDQFDMFNGAIDRYSWELLGKREIFVPYNSYRLHSDKLRYKEILTPLHINQDLTRYELHRVWVVDARLREGTSHIYSRRTFYIDEDSWQILSVDQYDTRGDIWRVSEGHCINYYDEPTFWTTLETHVDLLAGRYLAIGLDNESRMYDFALGRKPDNYTPSALRRQGMR